MESEKQRYLENLTLYQGLRSLVEDYYIETTSDTNQTNLQSEHKVYQLFNHFLTVAEASQKLSVVPETRLDEQLSKMNLNVLGLSKEQLLATQVDDSTYKQVISNTINHFLTNYRILHFYKSICFLSLNNDFHKESTKCTIFTILK